MSPEDREQLYELRRKSKIGKTLTAWEMAFCERMWKEHPEEYRQIGEEIREWAMRQVNPFA